MADTLSVDLKASLSWLFSEGLALSTLNDQAALEFAAAIADGVGDSQADKLWHDSRSVGASASDDLDLTALVSTIFGSSVTINFAKVKAILIVNLSTTAGQVLRVGGAGAGQAFAAPFASDAAGKVEVGPNSCLLLSHQKDGWTVTPGTGDILRVNNPNLAAVTYKIAIVGTSA
ncbi:MAG: hypothetical protein HYS13_01375 [Planctomycetia bacterium]|nr:hypothetical protein [Planctomycetia bacterium]